MSTEDTTPQEIVWEALSLDQAWELRRRWDETAGARVAWLQAESGLDLRDDLDSIAELWSWFLRWADATSGLDRSPAPVWWAPPVVDTLAYRRQFGVEAVCAYLEQLCLQRFPELVAAVNVYPKGRKEPTSPHEPGLGFTPAPDNGAAWPTGQVARSAARITALAEADPRRKNWGVAQYGDIPLWIEGAREDLKNATKPPTVVVEKIPADEAEELGGFAWDISFDEEVGYGQPELVEAYAEALEDLDGIDEVEHYDRGMIRVAGPIGVRKLRSWSRKWLETHAESVA